MPKEQCCKLIDAIANYPFDLSTVDQRSSVTNKIVQCTPVF